MMHSVAAARETLRELYLLNQRDDHADDHEREAERRATDRTLSNLEARVARLEREMDAVLRRRKGDRAEHP